MAHQAAGHTPTNVLTGWTTDPWAPGWRWRSRGSWTSYRVYRDERPRLPPWLSVPILLAAPFSAWESFSLITWYPGAAVLILLPLAIVLVVFRWVDSVAPEPRQGRVHALLWGFVIAGSISGFVNVAVEDGYGAFAALVVSAPVIEEATKGLLLVWAARRAEIDGPVDGAIYAAWSAAGFAASENLFYFTTAASKGWLVEEFIARGLFMPLAHPMFTIPIGFLVGRAIRRGSEPVAAFLLGLIPAIGAHALWNYGVLLGERGAVAESGALTMLFIVLFLGWIVAITAIRKSHERGMAGAGDLLALATRLFPTRSAIIDGALEVFSTPASRRRHRRTLSGRDQKRFDDGVVLYSRAMMRSRSDDPIAPIEFQVLLDHLAEVPGPTTGHHVGPAVLPPPAQTVAAEPPPSDWWNHSERNSRQPSPMSRPWWG